MKKFLAVFGTRPEIHKLAPVVHEINKREGMSCDTIFTGQQGQIADDSLKLFDISPHQSFQLFKRKNWFEDINI